jgi:hypothetical protein
MYQTLRATPPFPYAIIDEAVSALPGDVPAGSLKNNSVTELLFDRRVNCVESARSTLL